MPGRCARLLLAGWISFSAAAAVAESPARDPATVLWYTHPAQKWENALPVGNGRLAAMVFGKTDEERIQLNEDTLWSGGPYSSAVKGGAAALAGIQKLVFEGKWRQAHKAFGRSLMGYPVEQMKYQSLGDLVLAFPGTEAPEDYRLALDLDEAVVSVSYARGGVRFRREVFVSPVDQVIVVRLTADRPGSISFKAQLRGVRNDAHSNYGTEYFRMDGDGSDGLVLAGRSADYLGIAGRLRYEARLKVASEGGRVRVHEEDLFVEGADAVTLYVAAATSFVNYKDVSGDPHARVESVLAGLEKDPLSQVSKIDWVAKKWMLEMFMQQEHVGWDDPWLQSLDLEYHNLDPRRGLYFALAEQGRAERVISPERVSFCVDNPPANTRAAARGIAVRHLRDQVTNYVINWDSIGVDGKDPLNMQNPFHTYRTEIGRLLSNPRENTPDSTTPPAS